MVYEKWGLTEGTGPWKQTNHCKAADMLEISFWTVKNILKDNVNMGWTATKFVPRFFKWETGGELCELVCGPARDPQFLLKIITGDEMEIYGYDPETKQWSSCNKEREWGGGRYTQTWRACSMFSSTFLASYIMNFFCKDKFTHSYHHYYHTDA